MHTKHGLMRSWARLKTVGEMLHCVYVHKPVRLMVIATTRVAASSIAQRWLNARQVAMTVYVLLRAMRGLRVMQNRAISIWRIVHQVVALMATPSVFRIIVVTSLSFVTEATRFPPVSVLVVMYMHV